MRLSFTSFIYGLSVPGYSEILEMVCLSNYFKNVNAEEWITVCFSSTRE